MVAKPGGFDVEVPVAGIGPLAARFWTVEAPRGVVVIAHGLGEHGGAYAHVAEALGESARVDVLAFDFRGHGRSPGRRGVVRSYDDLTDDLRAAVAWASRSRPGLPRFVLGHSNGGQVVLRALLDGGLDVAGVVLSNPALRVAARVPAWKLGLGRFLRAVAPGVTVETSVDLTTLTRDPAMIELRRLDPLRHDRVNGALFFGLVEGGRSIAARAHEIETPVLLVVGASDPLIDPRFTLAAFDRIGSADKTLMTLPNALHEPLNDFGRDPLLRDVARWIADRIDRP